MRLRMAFMRNPRLEPLLDGTIKSDQIEFEWELGHPSTHFRRHLEENAHDVFEFSISDYMIVRDRAECSHLRWVALPIFPLRATLMLELHVNSISGIQNFGDLSGKRVGLPDYQMSAGVWLRIMLRHLYGIRPQDVVWFNGRPSSLSHGALEGLEQMALRGVRLVRLEEGVSLNEMLHQGQVDAAFGDGRTVPITDGPAVRKLLSLEQSRQLMVQFFQRARTTPVGHVVLAQQRLLEGHPGLDMALYQAFERSKREAYRCARTAVAGYPLFPREEILVQGPEFGDDPFPWGLDANRRMLEMVAEELMDEGLVRQRPNIDALFAEATRAT